MNTHTPGPWIVDEESEDNAGQTTLGITSDKRPGYVCGIHCAEGVDLDSIDRANARLIAACPEMYEALKLAEATIARLEVKHGEFSSTLGTQQVMAKALAKAEGRA